MRLTEVRDLLQTTAARWSADNVPRLAAAFSFYAVLSLAPLLVFAVVVGGYILGQADTQAQILTQVQEAVGKGGRDLVEELIKQANKPGAGAIASLISLVVTFFSASNLFLQLNDTVNAIWGIKTEGPFLKTLFLTRVGAFLGVLFFGVFVLGWVALDSWLHWLDERVPVLSLWKGLSVLVSIVFLAVVFAAAFRSLPKDRVSWKDTIVPAIITALGISLAKYALSLYFGLAKVTEAYGSAGALVVILLWIYYTSQIFFFGIEMTYVNSHQRGSHQGEPLREEPIPTLGA
ncbi:YihY/virulence factor BrkB family protein [bacterium]|nr:MAG: YihY/virulence factor BrkB family protein [bacterium]